MSNGNFLLTFRDNLSVPSSWFKNPLHLISAVKLMSTISESEAALHLEYVVLTDFELVAACHETWLYHWR